MRTSVQGGQALVVVLIIALVLGGICASLAILSVANATAGRNSVQRAVALTMAEIGVERAKTGIADQTSRTRIGMPIPSPTRQSAL